jgi:hypothetical protein
MGLGCSLLTSGLVAAKTIIRLIVVCWCNKFADVIRIRSFHLYIIVRLHFARRGRARPMKRVTNLYLDDESVAQGRELAEDMGLTLSPYVRVLLRQEYRRQQLLKQQQAQLQHA